ncbi:branched-chain amino acid aminotransferase II [Thozetella sp. PMI_491]|nr:branched-chain amino acid aminotransferase II [Thozetella sp. PMI_491]
MHPKVAINLVPEEHQKPVLDIRDPARKTYSHTTAHMLQVTWNAETGWGTPMMSKYDKIALHPTASVLHYATESFEGMKVHRGYDGNLRLFRPQLNCARLRQSNSRVCLPDFDPAQLLKLITSYLAIECSRWLPEPGSSLYIRPAMIGSGPAMGLQEPSETLFFLISSMCPPSSGSLSPAIKLLASSPDYIRAWPGGFGSVKLGASYGPALRAQGLAKRLGCQQMLWLWGKERLVTEAGASNFFVVWKRKESNVLELVTSSVGNDIVLNGVTRRSILDLARERLHEVEVTERDFSMNELTQAYHEGRLVEAFVSGTALFVVPVSAICDGDIEVQFPIAIADMDSTASASRYASTMATWLENIMYGKEEHEWGYLVQ